MEYRKLLSNSEIDAIVDGVASHLMQNYLDPTSPYLFVNVLDGGTPFFNLLYDKLDTNRFHLFPDAVKYQSYHGQNVSNRKLVQPITNVDKNFTKVIIVDDILDSGLTLCDLTDYFIGIGYTEIICVTLLEKDIEDRVFHPIPTYVSGYNISDIWVCGFGMDSIDGTHRDSPDIFQIIT